jgi:hypothetical protein
MSGEPAFWVNHRYDREHANSGSSRYAALVEQQLPAFADTFGDIAPVAFACAAWRLAVPPALAPGYVRWHRRILDATCVRNPWDGALVARMNLVAPWPRSLEWPRAWQRDRGWRDWPEVFGQFVRPSERDLAGSPYLRATLLAEIPVPLDDLPAAPEGPHDGAVQAAQRAVGVLVRELNDIVAPIVQRLDSHDRPGSIAP